MSQCKAGTLVPLIKGISSGKGRQLMLSLSNHRCAQGLRSHTLSHRHMARSTVSHLGLSRDTSADYTVTHLPAGHDETCVVRQARTPEWVQIGNDL
jgi:hypothetical protein